MKHTPSPVSGPSRYHAGPVGSEQKWDKTFYTSPAYVRQGRPEPGEPMRSSSALAGEILGPTTPQERWPADRVCTYPPCTTVLSIYNSSDRCTAHRKSTLFLGSGREPDAPKKKRTKSGRRLPPIPPAKSSG